MADLTPTQMKRAYEFALKEKGGDRLTTADIKNATKYIQSMDKIKPQKKGGGMAQRGMGAAYKKGGMTKARAGKMMNLKMVKKKKKK